MVEFAYDNAKHASTEYTPFELNYGHHSHVSYKEDVDLYSRSKATDELTEELRNLIAVCRENLQNAKKLQKRAHNKGTNPRSYAPGKKI